MVAQVNRKMLYLVRYGEIGLKSPYVLRQLLDRLVSNLQDLFQAEGVECVVRREFGRVFVWASGEAIAGAILARTFGVVSFSPVQQASSSPGALEATVLAQARSALAPGHTFAIRARRSGKQGPTSMELARTLGRAVQFGVPGAEVDLDSPEVELHVEVRGPRAYIFTQVIPGPGGLPLGSQGKVSVWIDGPAGAAAAWLMMKRGCRAFVGGPEVGRWEAALKRYDPKLRVFPAEDLQALEGATVGKGSKALVVGWSHARAGHLDHRGRLRVFHPMVGYSPQELEAMVSRLSHGSP